MKKDTSYIVRFLIAKLFTFIFLAMALVMIFSLGSTIFTGVLSGDDIMQLFLKGVNTGIIALAVFELALVINKEYSGEEEAKTQSKA